jgi:hypothetical protein
VIAWGEKGDVPGFQERMRDAVSADLVIVVPEASVAIERVNCLLAMEDWRGQRLFTSCGILVRTVPPSLRAPMASERHPIPFPAMSAIAFVVQQKESSVVVMTVDAVQSWRSVNQKIVMRPADWTGGLFRPGKLKRVRSRHRVQPILNFFLSQT